MKNIQKSTMACQRPSSPPWSIQPSNQWSILEIKNGVEVAKHNLTEKSIHKNSKMVLFGRAADQVDIELQHESISRFHARIAFDKEGETPWLRDLCSTHGVFVNKRRLPTNTIGRDETMSKTAGSRGVILNPGDVIQFGASSRFFFVVGPEEFSRNKTVFHSVMQCRKERTDITVQNNVVLDTVDAFVNNNDISDEHEFVLSDEKIPESLRPEWEKLKALQYKLENIETESERIQSKGDSDTLTSGQVKQLERNSERIAVLKDHIHCMETELYRKACPKITYEHRKSEKSTAFPDDDEDSFFDRTITTPKNFVELSQEGETFKTLMIKWNDIQREKAEVTSKLMILSQKETRLEDKLKKCNAEDDSFFIENDLNLVRETKQKLQQENVNLLKNLDDIEEMIRVANQKLTKSNDGLSWIDKSAISVNATTNQYHPLESNAAISTQVTEERCDKQSSEKASEQSLCPSKMIPPPKRLKSSCVFGTTGTVALLATATNSSNQQREQQHSKTMNRGKPVIETNHEAAIISIVQQYDTWQAPEGQDGSGRTKLNAKFAGRY